MRQGISSLLIVLVLLVIATRLLVTEPVDYSEALAARPDGLPLYSDRHQILAALKRENPRGIAASHISRVNADLARMSRIAAKTSAAWEYLGPGNIGGRSRALVIDPGQPSRMFLAGVSGGVWRTEDAGQSWRPTMDDLGNLNVVALAMSPVQPDILVAGSGEVYVSTDRPYSEFAGAGIYLTQDGGGSWSLLPATQTDEFRFVSDVLFSTAHPDTIFAATVSGVWRSPDLGQSWTRIYHAVNAQGMPLEVGCTDLDLLAVAEGERLLVACGGRRRNNRYHVDSLFEYECPSDCRGRLFRTTDPHGTARFEMVLSEQAMGRMAVASAPSDPDIVYVVGGSLTGGFDRDGDGEGEYDGQLHAVFRSDDGGRSFRATLRNNTANKYASLLLSDSVNAHRAECQFGDQKNNYRGQAWYDLALAVDPTDAARVWVGGIDLYRSDDGGVTWGQASYWWLRNAQDAETRARFVHADQHGVVFHPEYGGRVRNTQALYAINDGGIYVTFNALGNTATGTLSACVPTDSGVRWSALNNDYGVTQFYHGDVSAMGDIYVGGTQDNGTLLGQDQGGRTWAHILDGDGAYVAMDRQRPSTFFASMQGVTIHRTRDTGASFINVSESIMDSGLFIMPYTMDPSDPQTLYAAGRTLWRTQDGGESWARASAAFGVDFDDSISALAVAPSDPRRLYLGNRRGVFRVERARVTGPADVFPMSTPRLGWVSSLSIDVDDPDRVIASYSTVGGSHVFLSTDGGRTWEDRDGAGDGRLPDIPVHSVLQDPDHQSRWVAGTDQGVFVSVDAGYTWAHETGIPAVITEHLTMDDRPEGRRVYAFTHGRGAYRQRLGSTTGATGARSHGIDSETSGLWFDPQNPGHGFVVHVIDTPGGPATLTYWFAMQGGDPVWLVGVGGLDRALSRTRLDIAEGQGFPPLFVPELFALADWGGITMSLAQPDRGALAWNSIRPTFGSGSLALTRLAAIAKDADACISGAWFDPAQPGHGLLVQLVESADEPQLVVIWFAFVQDRQTWIIGSAPMHEGESALPMELLRGTSFPPHHRVDEIDRVSWGTLRLRWDMPDRMQIEWESDLPGFGADRLDLVRLSELRGYGCQ